MNANESESESDDPSIGRECDCGGTFLAIAVKGPGGIARRPCCGVEVFVVPTTIERSAAERAAADEGEAMTDGGSRWHAGSAAEFRAELYETPATAETRREVTDR